MEKRLRSSLRNSAEEFLSSAAALPFRSSKSVIRDSIINSIKPSSDLTSALPTALRDSISQSVAKFKKYTEADSNASPITPVSKRVRRSARNKKEKDESPSGSYEDEKRSVVGKLRVYAYTLRVCACHPQNVFEVSDLLPSAQVLHDNLILFESEESLLCEIADLCEDWWKRDLLGKETLISLALPFILSRSLTLKKKADVHRVYMLRDAFLLFDFEDESSEDLKNLLIRCVISPLYLKTEDGVKFVSFITGLSLQLTKEVCALIKSQIPFGRKSVLEAYGEIVFRAWKTDEGETKLEIERGFIQMLIEGAIYASSDTLSASIRRILGVFVTNRMTDGVEAVFFHLSEPVIFRSLQVANSNVRRNALFLLLDLFPLEDPQSTKEAKDVLLEKQFFLLEKLLMDECPAVRVVAVEGCCRILHHYWEIIPSSNIKKIITKIFCDMKDDASTDIRLSTIKGVIYLLDNPQSHEVLKVLLPKLGNLIEDSSSMICSAFLDLLLLLNENRSFPFHKVAPVDAIFSLLADDQPVIARKITKLLIPSYFPSKVTEEEACKRCVTLIKRSPRAGARFCEFAASEGASLKSLMKLFRVLIGLTMSAAKFDKESVEALLTAACHLCTILATDPSILAALKEELPAEKLKTLFSVARSPGARSCIYKIASAISFDISADIFEDCMKLVEKCHGLSEDPERQSEIRAAHKMMLSGSCFDQMFESMAELLHRAASTLSEDLHKHNARKKSKSSKKVSSKNSESNRKKSSSINSGFLKDYGVAVGIAWQVKDLLLYDDTRNAVLNSESLERAYTALKLISEASILHCLQYDCISVCPVSAYTALSLNMSLYGNTDNGKVSHQETCSIMALDHLLKCSYTLLLESLNLSSIAPGCSSDAEECGGGTKSNRISNMVKIITKVLQFIVEVITMNPSLHNHERCLSFATESFKFIIARLREYATAQLQFNEEHIDEMFVCLKSSFTYGAKFLSLVLKSPELPLPIAGAYALVNELWNLPVSIEELLNSGYASRFVTVVKPWIPDLILALGSHSLLKQSSEEEGHSESFESASLGFPSWFHTLARIELRELEDEELETERVEHAKYFPAFKKLLETKCELLKANVDILDAVGVILLNGSQMALQEKKFDIVLGLVRYIFVKLKSPDDRKWKKLRMMASVAEKLHSKLTVEAEDPGNCEDDRRKLYTAKELVEPILLM